MSELESKLAKLLDKADESIKHADNCGLNTYMGNDQTYYCTCGREYRIRCLQIRVMATLISVARASWDDSSDDYLLAFGEKVLNE